MIRTVTGRNAINRDRISRCRRWLPSIQLSTVSATPYDDTEAEESPPVLLRLNSARLGYPNASHGTNHHQLHHHHRNPLHLTVSPATEGGHAVVGRNGVGKSLLSNALAHQSLEGPEESHLLGGELEFTERWSRWAVSRVSFESHEALLQRGGTAYAALTPHGGRLSKAAEFLVVRFGLYPLLNRDVRTLSTGEIRKVLLVRALSIRPRLLILDNAFDGLDVESRENLKDLVSRTLRGFRPDILVQGVDAKNTAHTQVMLMSHRPEEIVDEVSTVSVMSENGLETEPRGDRTGEELFSFALGENWNKSTLWDDPTLPSVEEIRALWECEEKVSSSSIIEATNLSVSRNDATLLSNLDWIVKQGERWLVAGGNGAGKSTLSRLLAKPDMRPESVRVSTDNVGWVSTELHLSISKSTQTAREILLGESGKDCLADAVSKWFNLDVATLQRPFHQLSQGEQKLVLIGSALAQQPRLLIIDEPLQGLDFHNRRKVLGIIERVLQATDTSLIYVTHHFEELLPSISHVLHLKQGKSVYTGELAAYDPATL